MVQRQISSERKVIYYLGMALLVVGVLLILSTFLSAVLHFGDFANFAERSRSMMWRVILGVVLTVAGAVLQRAGRTGLAGSRIKRDSEQARLDAEPWPRMDGGLTKDALEQAEIGLGAASSDGILFDEKLRRLQKLREEGLITEKEFESTKKEILDHP